MDWEQLRNGDGTINLMRAFNCLPGVSGLYRDRAYAYIDSVESLQPINSRQAAATVLATALHIARADSEP